MLTDKQTNTQTDTTENNTTLAVQVVIMTAYVFERTTTTSFVFSSRTRSEFSADTSREAITRIGFICKYNIITRYYPLRNYTVTVT